MIFSAWSLKAKVRFLLRSIARTKYFQCICVRADHVTHGLDRALSRVKICILWHHKEHYEFSSYVFLKGSSRPHWKKLLALSSHSQVLQFFNHAMITIYGKQFTANIKKWVVNTIICKRLQRLRVKSILQNLGWPRSGRTGRTVLSTNNKIAEIYNLMLNRNWNKGINKHSDYKHLQDATKTNVFYMKWSALSLKLKHSHCSHHRMNKTCTIPMSSI